MNNIEYLEDMILPIENEEGKKVNCEVIAIFPLKERQYIVLSPEGIEDSWLYRFVPVGEEEFNLEYIEDEKELEEASEEFYSLLEEAEIDEVLE